jgi:hypothetical protein
MRSRASRFVFVAFMAVIGIAAAALYGSRVLAQEGWTNQCTSTISANFNGTAIPGGSSILFTSVLTPAGQLTNPGSGPQGAIYVESFQISFTANGTTFYCYNHQPVNVLNFSSSATTAQLTYYQSSNSWVSTFPTKLPGNVLLAPCILEVPDGSVGCCNAAFGLPGGIQPVTWTMTFQSDTEQPIVWQWGAAVYSQFPPAQIAGCGTNCIAGGETGTRFDEMGAKATDDVPSQDCVNATGNPFEPGTGTTSCSAPYADLAGTPEGVNSDSQPWKQFLLAGGTGNGGSNWTGTLSAVGSCIPMPTD